MFNNNQQNAVTSPLTMIEIKSEKFRTISGHETEIRWIKVMVLDKRQRRTEEYFEIDPPLTDGGRVPESVKDIRQCCVCLNLFHKESVQKCFSCGGDFCRGCRGETITEGIQVIQTCETCYVADHTGFIKKTLKRFWTL